MKIRRLFIAIISVIVVLLTSFFVIIPLVFHNNFIKDYCTLPQSDGHMDKISFDGKEYTFVVSEYEWNTGYGDLHLTSDIYYDGTTGKKISNYENVIARITPYSGGRADSIKVVVEYENSVGDLVMDTVFFDSNLGLMNRDSITNTQWYMLEHNLGRINNLLKHFYDRWKVFEFKELNYEDLRKG